jgi:hypothetical protein
MKTGEGEVQQIEYHRIMGALKSEMDELKNVHKKQVEETKQSKDHLCYHCGRGEYIIGFKIKDCPSTTCPHIIDKQDFTEEYNRLHDKANNLKIMTQKIHVKYYQDPGGDLPNMFYRLDMQAENYYKALEYLTNIMNTCMGVITFTSIEILR